MNMQMNGSSEATAFPDGENWLNWKGTLKGTAGTPYESMTFHLQITFPSDYPYKPPTITFETPCFHPNVDQHGNICLDILKVRQGAADSSSCCTQRHVCICWCRINGRLHTVLTQY